jgi:5-enolpyruvylshikimate-3-phosphate synthase
LRGIEVPPALVSIAMDEMPLLFAMAALADGETVVTGASELRVKESDRLAAMSSGLAALGVAVEVLPDGMRIRGGTVRGGVVDSQNDHRVAMAFAVLGARADSAITIHGVQNVATSFPGFAQMAQATGLRLAEEA